MMPIDRLLATLVTLDPIAMFTEIVEAMGDDPSDAIAEAESDGMVESYEVEEEGLAIVLTPFGAVRCGVELREVADDDYRWVAAGTIEPPARSRAKGSEWGGLLWAVDPAPGPIAQAFAQEHAERFERQSAPAMRNGHKPDHDRLPRPSVYLGGIKPKSVGDREFLRGFEFGNLARLHSPNRF